MLSPLEFDKITIDHIADYFDNKISVDVLRLDKLHPVISGNKWFKLRYFIDEAKAKKIKQIVTFGGAWSNHIIATAALANMYDLSSIGIIRGEEPEKYSATLIAAKAYGMQLIFIPRDQYQEKKIPNELITQEYLLIPEGGYSEYGADGASTIADYIPNEYTHISCACGTGTMMAGLLNATDKVSILGISVLKNNLSLTDSVMHLLKNKKQNNFSLLHDYHFGGYAKSNSELVSFMNDCFDKTGIPTDRVYTAKLFYAIHDLCKKRFFKPNDRLLIIHSGGLQGNASWPPGYLHF